jgi:hypothetical protein
MSSLVFVSERTNKRHHHHQTGQRGLVFDEFLDRIVHRSQIEDILRIRRVWGELVDDAATGGIPQKGNVFVYRRRGSYPVGRFVVGFASVSAHFHKESGEAHSDPVMQKFQHPSDDISILEE